MIESNAVVFVSNHCHLIHIPALYTTAEVLDKKFHLLLFKEDCHTQLMAQFRIYQVPGDYKS